MSEFEAYGRASTLVKLNADRNNPTIPKFARLQADKAHAKIVNQLKDKKLMSLREQLIKATRAGDNRLSIRIEKQMRDHEKADKETGR